MVALVWGGGMSQRGGRSGRGGEYTAEGFRLVGRRFGEVLRTRRLLCFVVFC